METRTLTKEEQRFIYVAFVCVDFLQLPLIEILASEIKPADLFQKISTCLKLENGKALTLTQQNICFLKPPKIPDYTKFDVTLLYKLLRNLCSSLTPQQDWGKKPKGIDMLIVHDIERLRLIRNDFAHASSSEFTEDKFKQIWKNLKTVIQRIQNFTSLIGCKTNYMDKLKKIKTREFGCDDLEKYKLIVKSVLRSDQPEILIKGDMEREVLCGDTACFEVEIQQADLTRWTITWRKMIGNRIEQINTSTSRYTDSTDRKLVIHSVCKEDRGNYQAVLSEKVSNGKSVLQVVSNVIFLHALGEPPFPPKLKVTNGREDIFIHYQYEKPMRSPRVSMLQWTKNGLKLNLMNEKYLGGGLDDGCLTIKSPTTNDQGTYCCTVSNAVGSESQEVKLDVPNATIFKETIVYCGSSTELSAQISSCPSPDEVMWQRSSDGNSFNYIDIDEPEYFRSTNDTLSPLLRIPKATFDVQLYYRLFLRNKLGENISNTIYLNITGSAPNIMVSHDVCFQNCSVKLIGNVYLCSGKFPAIQDVFWTKDGAKLDIKGSGGKYSEVGVYDPSLIIYNVNHHDIGSYQLTATNAVGSTKSDVIVLGDPQIVLEKTERKEDDSFLFTMTIKAIPEPTNIQWSIKKNNDVAFELLNINDYEYKGTTDTFPHPVLVVKSSKFEKYKFQIEVQNFTGNETFIIQDEKLPKVPKSDNNIDGLGKFYIDGGASVRFSDISNKIAENFPKEKINQLKDIIQDSCKVEDTTSLEQAVTTRDILRVLKKNKLFTQSDVICMQYLLKRTDCQHLYTQCIKYAEEQNALCFYEKPLDNEFKGAKFHVQGNLSEYSKRQIEKIKETVASIVGCSPKEIHENGYHKSSSFFVVLSMKELYTRKLLFIEQDEKDKLFQLNIDYIIVDKDPVYLERSQDLQASGSLPFQKSAAAVDTPLTNPVTTRKPYLHVQPFQNQILENTKTKPLSPVPKSLPSVPKLQSHLPAKDAPPLFPRSKSILDKPAPAPYSQVKPNSNITCGNKLDVQKDKDSSGDKVDDVCVEAICEEASKSPKLLVAAIDFGTEYSGYAYSFKWEWTKVKINHWGGGENLSYKTPSVLLLNPDQSFNSFGYQAEKKYAALAENGSECKKYFYFQRFKMILWTSLEKRVHRKTQCIANNGVQVDAIKVFTHCINHMKEHLLKALEYIQIDKITVDDIYFVLTVPAIWDDTAKMFMREAAVMAGIKSNQLLIALEPEAASIYCQLSYLESTDKSRKFFPENETDAKYMVLDLGGGTADITIHQLKKDGSLAELVPASGGSWGGTCVDKAFNNFLTNLFGKSIMNIFHTDPEYLEDSLDFWTDFEFKKRAFEVNTKNEFVTGQKFAIRIPVAIKEIEEKQSNSKGKSIDFVINSVIARSSYRNVLTFENGILLVEASFFVRMFVPTIDLLVNHLKQLYKDIGGDLKVILMVGGFSESSVIQDAIKKEFEGKCRVVVPNQAGLAVVKGAVYFGHQPDLISERVSRYTYGIQIWPAFNETKHDKSKRIVMDDRPRCKDVFFKFVTKGEKIKPGNKKSFIFKSLRPNAKTLDCVVFISNEKNPKYVDDKGCAKLGTLNIPLDGVDRNFEIEESLIFGDTELHVTACNCTNKIEYKVSFDLLSEDINLP